MFFKGGVPSLLEPEDLVDSEVTLTGVFLSYFNSRREFLGSRVLTNDPADLVVRPLGHLFGPTIARVAFTRSTYVRDFVFRFAELLSDRLDRNLIAKALSGHNQDYEL